MSKLSTRIVLSAVLSLILIAGVFMTYRIASANTAGKSMGMYVLSGGLVNQLQPQSSSEAQEETQPLVDPFLNEKGEGHGGCESENYNDPSDL